MKLHEPPLWDEEWAADELACDAEYRWLLLDHGFNLRLVAVPVDDEAGLGYHWAWCFRRDTEAAVRAVAAWDPDTQDEPMGWHKRPGGDEPRRAPRRDAAPDYNRPRCVHGAYPGECGSIGCPAWTGLRREASCRTAATWKG